MIFEIFCKLKLSLRNIMQDFGIGYVFKTKIYNKVAIKSTQTTNCQSIYYEINDSV